MPKAGSSHYEEHLTRSLNLRVQREAGNGECSNGSSHNWLKKYRPKHAVCPHQEDYCDTCTSRKEQINAKQTTINRLRQAGATTPEEIQQLEEEVKALGQSLENHREEAQAGHQ